MSGMSEGALGVVVTAIPVMLVASYFASPGTFVGWALNNKRRRWRDRKAPSSRPIWPDPGFTDQLMAWVLLIATGCCVVAEIVLLYQVIWTGEPFPEWVQVVATGGSVAVGVLLLMEVAIAPTRLQTLDRVRERTLVSARENDRILDSIQRSVGESAAALRDLVTSMPPAPQASTSRPWWRFRKPR